MNRPPGQNSTPPPPQPAVPPSGTKLPHALLARVAPPPPRRTKARSRFSLPSPKRFDWVFRKEAAVAAWVVLIAGVLLPSRGVGMSFCGLFQLCHLPCPGCGMTRSVSSFLHGQWGLSWQFHPMGWLAVVGSLWVASAVFWPARWRASVGRWIDSHEGFLWRVFWGVLGLWMLFGLARIVMVLIGLVRFPPA